MAAATAAATIHVFSFGRVHWRPLPAYFLFSFSLLFSFLSFNFIVNKPLRRSKMLENSTKMKMALRMCVYVCASVESIYAIRTQLRNEMLSIMASVHEKSVWRFSCIRVVL